MLPLEDPSGSICTSRVIIALSKLSLYMILFALYKVLSLVYIRQSLMLPLNLVNEILQVRNELFVFDTI